MMVMKIFFAAEALNTDAQLLIIRGGSLIFWVNSFDITLGLQENIGGVPHFGVLFHFHDQIFPTYPPPSPLASMDS
jgi:hypothetical protein